MSPTPATVAPPDAGGLPVGWYARFETSRGTFLARLLPEQAPQAVAYFAALAAGRLEWSDPVTGDSQRRPYYDGVPIHLAKAGQRFEAGDRSGTGQGAPTLFVPLEGPGPLDFRKPGRLGLTRGAGGRISGVQFFVTAAGLPWLDGAHPCFGEVVQGLDVVRRITEVKTYSNGRPIESVMLDRVQVFASGDPPPLPQPQPYDARPSVFGLKPGKSRW